MLFGEKIAEPLEGAERKEGVSMGRRKRIWEAVFLCVALWWAFPASGGASSRPASENPYKGVSTLLRFDTLLMIAHTGAGTSGFPSDRKLFFASPDAKEVLSGTGAIVRQGNAVAARDVYGGLGFDAVVAHDQNNIPHLVQVYGQADDNASIKVEAQTVTVGAPAGSSVPLSLAPSGSFTMDRNSLQSVQMLVSDWDGDGAEDGVAIMASQRGMAYAHPIQAFGIGNLATAGSSGKNIFRIEWEDVFQDRLFSDPSAGLRAATGDLDGDGVQEIVVLFEQHISTIPEVTVSKILMLRVVPDAKSSGWKYTVVKQAQIELPLYGAHLTQIARMAFDIATGDLDGDGKDEIFWAGFTNNPSEAAAPYGLRWGVLKLVGNALSQLSSGEKPLYALKTVNNPDAVNRCAVADVDGDGANELLVYYSHPADHSLNLAWSKFSPSGVTFQIQQIAGGSSNPLREIDLATANLTGTVVPKSPTGNAVHLVCASNRLNEDPISAAIYVWDQPSGKFKKTSTFNNNVHFSIGAGALKLLPGDYTNAGIRLGAPVHIVIEDQITPLVVMQEPPKHMDYTLVDTGKYGVLNLTRYFDFYTNFFNSQTTGTGVSSSQKAESTSALSTKSDFSFGYKCKTPVSKSDTTVQFEGALKDTTATTDETLNESYSSSSSSIKAATNGDDYVACRCRTVDIWRYPVLGQKGLQGGEQIWLSVSVPAPQTVMNFTGMQVPWFQPPWSNGNLLSYPSDRTQLDDYAEIAKLGEGQDFLISRNKTSWEVGWTQETKKEKTHTEKVTHQSDTGFSLSEKFKVFGFHGDTSVSFSSSTDDSSEKSSTETNTFSTETSFSMESPGTFTAINNSNAYVVAPFAYKSPAGVLKVAYTARIPQGNLAWWYARYAQAPDVALNLPCVWTMKEENVWEWDESPLNNPNARRIRGFFIYDASGDMEGDAISTTQPVLLRCRVHNFSMAAPNNADPTARNVVVRFLVAPYTPSTQTEGPRKLIGNVTVPAIAPWGGLGKNWTFADMKWDVTQVSDGHYRIYVILNPDKTLPELPYHGLGETNDNNQGWYEVFVAKPQNTAQAVYNGPISAPASLSGTVQVERSGDRDLRIRGVGRNSGSRAMTDVVVTLYEGSTTSGDAFAQAYIPGILPGGEYPFTLKHRLSRADVGSLTAFLHYKLEETNWTDNIVTVTLPPAPSSPRSSGGGCVAGGLSESWALLLLVPLGALRRRR